MMPYKSWRCGTPAEVADQPCKTRPLNISLQPTAVSEMLRRRG
jgi:hypothetical protein